MKKIFTFLLCLIISCITVFAVACGGSDFVTTDMLNWGAVDKTTQGGFVVETDNYAYFINGEGVTGGDNKYGVPVKGTLMAVDKSTLGTENVKTSIVVPKLFLAKDRSAGVYIYGSGAETYVYYGTPCIEKDSSGKPASSYMTFMRTRLDGKESEDFFTINSLSQEYRFVERDGVVYIVYYDSADQAIKTFNTQTKQTTLIAKTDATTTTEVTINGKTYYVSLGGYKFCSADEGAVVIYTLTVFNENYYPSKAEEEDYTRATAKFNVLVSYDVNDEKVALDGCDFKGSVVANGNEGNLTYSVARVQKGAEEDFVILTTTDANSKVVNSIVTKAEIKDLNKWQKTFSSDLVSGSGILVNETAYYYVDTEKQVIIKTTLVGDRFNEEYKIATSSSATTLLFIDDGYIYYYNSDNAIACIKIPVEGQSVEKNEIKVSEGLVSSSWFAPEVIKTTNGTFVLYCDITTAGASYVKYVNVNNKEDVAIDEDEDGTADKYEFSGHLFLGQRLDADIANDAVLAIENIEAGEISFTEENGVLTSKSTTEAREIYESLTKEQKELVSEDVYKKLLNAEEAVKLANLYNKLKGVVKYEEMNDTQKAEFKTSIAQDYQNAKAKRQELIDSEDFDYVSIRDRLNNNLKYYFQRLDAILNA